MRQEINLYTIDFRRGNQPLSSGLVVRATVGFFVLLMLFEAFTAWQLFSGRDQLEQLEAEQQLVAARLETLKASRPFSERASLVSKVEALRADLRRREELQSLISGQNLGNAIGFSAYMEAMARQASDDVSLTHIRLLNGGDYLELGGWTRRPEAVPLYLHKLRDEYSFQKVKFGVLGIKQEREKQDRAFGHRLRFTLGPSEGES